MARDWFEWHRENQRSDKAEDSLDALLSDDDLPSQDGEDSSVAEQQLHDDTKPSKKAKGRESVRLRRHRRGTQPAIESDSSLPSDDEDDYVDESESDEASKPGVSLRKRTIVGVAALCAVAVIGGTAAWAMTSKNGDSSADTHATSDKATAHKDIDPAALVGVAGTACKPAADETAIEVGTDDLREAIASFETAYFNKDAPAVTAAFASSSPLSSKDWSPVITEAVPDGTTWCARMQPQVDNTVDVAVVVNKPDGESVVYEQIVTGTRNENVWKLVSFEAHE